MKFTLNELIHTVINSNIDNENKVNLIANLCKGRQITDCLFLKTYDFDICECWIRTEDNIIQPSGYTPNDIISAFVEYNNNKKIK